MPKSSIWIINRTVQILLYPDDHCAIGSEMICTVISPHTRNMPTKEFP